MRRLCPRRLGSFVQANAQRLLLLLGLALLVLCAAINSVKLDIELASWIQRTARIDNELQAIEAAIGDGAGTNSLLIMQTPKKNINHKHAESVENNVLTVESLMIHLEALAIATHVTVDLFDISWSLKDICYSPTLPDYEGLLVNQMLDHLMPCAIKTPLDCFWEGSKLLGPEHEVRFSSIGPKLKWTSLDPLAMIEAKRRAHPHATFPYDALISWMKRIGMTNGYQDRPCLDPSDPNCPFTAPNKQSGLSPNVGVELTGGCRGLATKQMHWLEEEIVGGVVRNKSNYIVRADALQSTVQLMGERDVYDYWRKTSKVQDINNWSTEKARLVLESWQKRFMDELAQFSRTSMGAKNSYKIHAITPKSMLEPIDNRTILDLTSFKLTCVLMTFFICIIYPNFEILNEENQSITSSSYNKWARVDDKATPASAQELEVKVIHVHRLQVVLIALITSLIVCLTFVASLGLSSFMNLPINMATTQILPPLALYYGFRQALMIANIYSINFKSVPLQELTTECINEILPVLMLEAITLIAPLVVASSFPVHATRVFTFQAITYILLSTSTSTLLVPSLLITFLTRNSSFQTRGDKSTIQIKYSTNQKLTPRTSSPSVLSIKSRNSGTRSATDLDNDPCIEDQILSRLQEDLRNLRAESQQPTSNINFSAYVRADGVKTSFKLTTSRTLSQHSVSQTQLQSPEINHWNLPDLVLGNDYYNNNDKYNGRLSQNSDDDDSILSFSDKDHVNEADTEVQNIEKEVASSMLDKFVSQYFTILASNQYVQTLAVLLRLILFVALTLHIPYVRYGLQLKDIIIHGTSEYNSFSLQDRYFPIYNMFAITQGEFDYSANQRLMYEFHERLGQIEGIVKEDSQLQSKFWLIYFRDWLLELQERFDTERNKSLVFNGGWKDEASDAAKLAFKLLVQTGRLDNPIDKSQVESVRLVDKNGIINQKAFYYYLTAWVMNDAFTYSNSEANFRPEPKTWIENVDDLRIERARPLTYAQIPFLLKLSEGKDSLETINQIRQISEVFDQLGLSNFPTGVPFIFWDQFVNLDLLLVAALIIVTVSLLTIIGTFVGNFRLAAILVGTTLLSALECYGFLGYMSIHFNTTFAVLLIGFVGLTTIQTMHTVLCFQSEEGDMSKRVERTFKYGAVLIVTSSLLLLLPAIVFQSSKFDFMMKYSFTLFLSIGTNLINSLVLIPILLSLFGPQQTSEPIVETANINHQHKKNNKSSRASSVEKKRMRKNLHVIGHDKRSSSGKVCIGRKKRSFQRAQSEMSLSTISEEP